MIFAGMFGSERVARLTWLQRWLYAALVLSCDDFGLFEADAALIRGDAIPRDTRKVSVRDVENGLQAMAAEQVQLVKFYTVSGKRYGILWNYRQKKGYKLRRQECPPPPPEHLEWQKSAEIPWTTASLHPKEPKPNQSKANQMEGEIKPIQMGVALAALCAYCLDACRMRLTPADFARILKNVYPEHDWAVVKALEHMASRDARTRWQDVTTPPALITTIAQQIRDGIGPHPEGDYEPFLNWCTRRGINPKGGPA